MSAGLAVALTLGAAVTLGVGDGSDVDDGADVEAPPVVHAVNVRPRANTRSVGLGDAMLISGSTRDLDSGALPVQMLAEGSRFADRAKEPRPGGPRLRLQMSA